MNKIAPTVLLFCLIATSALATGRSLEHRGRKLLDQTVTLTPDNANFNLRVYGIRNSRPTDQCIINGHPGNDWNPEQGPLRIVVPDGVTSQIGFNVGGIDDYVQAYSQTQSPNLQTQIGARGELTGITFTSNRTNGAEAFITGARIFSYNGAPNCALGLTFQAAQPVTPPAEPPAEPTAEPTATPSPTPPETVYPKNPCYCQSGNNGGTVCFNFNQATSDINCAPPAGLNCQAGQAEAGAYTQQAGPVYFC